MIRGGASQPVRQGPGLAGGDPTSELEPVFSADAHSDRLGLQDRLLRECIAHRCEQGFPLTEEVPPPPAGVTGSDDSAHPPWSTRSEHLAQNETGSHARQEPAQRQGDQLRAGPFPHNRKSHRVKLIRPFVPVNREH